MRRAILVGACALLWLPGIVNARDIMSEMVPSQTSAPDNEGRGNMITITKRELYSGSMWQLNFVNHAFGIVINNLIVNRGCKSQESQSFPLNLKFGDSGLLAHYLCEPIQVEIDTNLGNQIYVWDALTQDGVSARRSFGPAGWMVEVTGRVSKVVVKDVAINQGSCRATPIRAYEKAYDDGVLLFGQRVRVMASCAPTKIAVTTDEGVATFYYLDNPPSP